MMFVLRSLFRNLSGCLLLVAAIGLLPTLASPARAQGQAPQMFGAGDVDAVTVRATVKSVDMKTRKVTLVSANGETMTMKAGDQVQNLAQVKPGDVVVARFYESVAFIVAPPGTKLPEDAMAVAEAKAVPGELPAGGVATKMVVTGLVVGVNPTAHTLSLVDPAGGEVHTIKVKDPQYQQMMDKIKVGDTITAVISEAVVGVVEPAK
jgi:Cu/Ag efflux protein CusF